ncbi:hypothetical protein GCM10010275_43490 [Streptomyces litmocidini]|uniref:hypothetical protein n=1 Tax=Streptomyces litmocidini TaxID=67318 RepID=UPI00167CD32C|nr:hypothetical protein GCM10010275_43490 [Streptomyces litmocidini]
MDGHRITVVSERDPAALPRKTLDVDVDVGLDVDLDLDVVVEAAGRFRTRDDAGPHLRAGARKGLLPVPGKDVDATIVMGPTSTPMTRCSTT